MYETFPNRLFLTTFVPMNLIQITSLEQPGPDRFTRLTETQLRGGKGGVNCGGNGSGNGGSNSGGTGGGTGANSGGIGGGSFIAESPNVILRALEAGLEPLSMLCETGFADAALRSSDNPMRGDTPFSGSDNPLRSDDNLRSSDDSRACKHDSPAAENDSPAGKIFRRAGDIPIYVGSPELLSRITGYSLLRGISCEFRRPAPRTAAEVCGITGNASAAPDAHPGAAPSATPAAPTTSSARRIAVIHGVVDAANIGAIFRSAAALGIDAILLSPDSCDPLNRRTVRTSMGTVFQIPWAILDGPDTIAQLHRLGFKTAAMALRDDALAPDTPELQAVERLAIILGNEGNGLPQPLIEASDYVVCIPMSHGVDSLNVAIAGAVAFYVLRK